MNDFHAFNSTRGGGGGGPFDFSELKGCLICLILAIVVMAPVVLVIAIYRALPDIVQAIILIIILLFMGAAVIYGIFFEDK